MMILSEEAKKQKKRAIHSDVFGCYHELLAMGTRLHPRGLSHSEILAVERKIDEMDCLR